MATRTYQFFGRAYASAGQVTVTTTFNRIQRFSGPVTTNAGPISLSSDVALDQLFTFDEDTSVTGSIPLQIQVTGGSLVFGIIRGNYTGIVDNTDYHADPVVPNYATPPEDYWDDVNNNTRASDGKDNVMINGVVKVRNVVRDSDIGDWWYTIPDGGVFTCDYFIDPDKVITGPTSTSNSTP
jgi:hypothetical protein